MRRKLYFALIFKNTQWYLYNGGLIVRSVLALFIRMQMKQYKAI